MQTALTGQGVALARLPLVHEQLQRGELVEPFGKAGSYAIQGLAGCFAQKIVGSYTSIVGLPLTEVVGMLAAEGFPLHFNWIKAADLEPL